MPHTDSIPRLHRLLSVLRSAHARDSDEWRRRMESDDPRHAIR